MEDDILLLQELLNVSFPQSYVDVLNTQAYADTRAGILGLPISLDLSSAWGATEFLRVERPDLGNTFVVIKIMDSTALCLDLKSGNKDDAPVVEIDLEADTAPTSVSESLQKYLAEPESNSRQEILRLSNAFNSDNAYWFQRGLERLDWHMKNSSFQYDHKEGGRLPRTHVWRPYRFCVQDVILGITVIRHDKMYNRLKVDVFLTAWIDEYKKESGCLALALIILSDAYRCGGSMEIKFTKYVEGGKVPQKLVDLAKKHEVNLNSENVAQGGISSAEAKRLYMALSGFKQKIIDMVSAMEEEGKLFSASVCYAMHHGVWSKEEVEVILLLSKAPESILTGSYPVELWHLYLHDLQVGRTALMGTYLDRHLRVRLHPHKSTDNDTENNELTELEDDERDVQVKFDPDICGKRYILDDSENDEVPVPWIEHGVDSIMLGPDKNLLVLLRARDAEDLRCKFESDLDKASKVKNHNHKDLVCIMVPADFKRLEDQEKLKFAANAKENDIGIIICPEFVIQLDQAVSQRFESIKVMRS